ncbi:four helix bundle protein [uncultured Aquimarina sp.]|uniref:four helix bundle protein n=1 Tax=uncultured Aquimarina sp. TaxID=575652 RepID=UPI002637DE58|nr:four helix bundle protein [uncultured Aquimarina sp.]
MKICLKELRESQVNLQVLREAELINDVDKFDMIMQECKELVAIFTSSIKTTNNK